jgi:hypothetical protein
VPNLVRTPGDLVAAVGELAEPERWDEAMSRIRAALCDNTVETLADRLSQAYGRVDFNAERQEQWQSTSGSR